MIRENNFLRKLQLAKLFSIKFSVDWCYFFMFLKQKIQNSLIITTKTCTRIHIFKCIYLDGENDSDSAVKTKNAQFFMIFPNISFFNMIVAEWYSFKFSVYSVILSYSEQHSKKFFEKKLSNQLFFKQNQTGSGGLRTRDP